MDQNTVHLLVDNDMVQKRDTANAALSAAKLQTAIDAALADVGLTGFAAARAKRQVAAALAEGDLAAAVTHAVLSAGAAPAQGKAMLPPVYLEAMFGSDA